MNRSRILKFSAAIVGTLTAGAALATAIVFSSLPKTEGEIIVAGLSAPVSITRDAHGVPVIAAETALDAYFALGFVHAQDRLWQMEMMRRAGAGRLSEVFGDATIDKDRFTRTLGLYRLAEAQASTLPDALRVVLEAYAAGVNGWMTTHTGALPPEFLLLGHEPEPWRVADTLVWNRLMGLRLGRNWQSELSRARIVRHLQGSGLPAGLVDDLWPAVPSDAPTTLSHRPDATFADPAGPDYALVEAMTDGASNAWVLSGARTTTGAPMLAGDPHLRFSAPIMWYLARLTAPGMDVTGATAPGTPFTLIGRNDRIAWGITNAGGDVSDLFEETPDPADPSRYVIPGGSEAFTIHIETIVVKGGPDVELRVRETRHGPIISEVSAEVDDKDRLYALATPVLRDDDRTVEGMWAINRAGDWAEFRAAARLFHTPHLNLFFAARDGDIGFISAGRIPIRQDRDGRLPVDGAIAANDWLGFIPFDALPQSHNPPSGQFVNANNSVVDADYPYLLTTDWAEPYRAERIEAMLAAHKTFSLDDMAVLQNDIVSTAAQSLMPLLLAFEPTSDRQRRAIALLGAWDFAMRRDRPEPLIYTAWRRQIARALAEDELGPLFDEYWGLKDSRRALFVKVQLDTQPAWCDDVATPAVRETCASRLGLSLDRALDEITTTQGDVIEDWRWGDAHQATFPHPVFGMLPLLDRLSEIRIPSDGGDHTVNRGETSGGTAERPYEHFDGAGLRVIYDLADLDNSRFVIATGQSGNPLSAHYDDLLETWRDGKYLTIGPASGSAATRALVLTPPPRAGE